MVRRILDFLCQRDVRTLERPGRPLHAETRMVETIAPRRIIRAYALCPLCGECYPSEVSMWGHVCERQAS